jgi:hypothetical protein
MAISNKINIDVDSAAFAGGARMRAGCDNPASEVITDPRSWSISRRSKSSLRTSPFNSPAGFAMTASFDPE